MQEVIIAWIGVRHALEMLSLVASLLVAVRSLCVRQAPLIDSVVATAVDGDAVNPFCFTTLRSDFE